MSPNRSTKLQPPNLPTQTLSTMPRFSLFLSKFCPLYEHYRHKFRMYRIRKYLVKYAAKPLQ
jgi:hypothetical protein